MSESVPKERVVRIAADGVSEDRLSSDDEAMNLRALQEERVIP